MTELGRVKHRGFEIVYKADWSIKSKEAKPMTDLHLWNVHYKVIDTVFRGRRFDFVIVQAYPKLWRDIIHAILYSTAGGMYE